MRLTWTLPWPPTLNTMYPGTTRRRLSDKGKAYRAQVQSITFPPMRLSGDLSATLYLTAPDNRKRDLDNLFKPVFDALQHSGIFEDDSQIKKITAELFPPEKGQKGSCIVTLEEMNGSKGYATG